MFVFLIKLFWSKIVLLIICVYMYVMIDVLGCDNVVDFDFVLYNEEVWDDLGEREFIVFNVNYDGVGNVVFSSDLSVVLW